ncbi:LuxR family maltose regulon positive regulatory protein [Microbacterium terrae]|uniref:HTH-type transcriptional regulator MalT n=1 Tax=Microbacterium terrae TaxID=69369 RepID=A0A0M2H2P3_9MICO|nr:LuxR C-terminal-related transcriptional regulator [Microbacterium terrae]KJL40538.1 HTH-type transcriptional regulator MalT [Microbacterium terrae]MBP1079137.1 LuxR family maltose regulon positive regulatory protein [Microbacterium terrae]GLJ98538.1 hypothetical protein GCM10017594_17350 [Microbacterium terrae]
MEFAPTHPPHAVERRDLCARLDHALTAPLTLVVAPAGSGKSVLLSQWAAGLRATRVIWLDMSSADEDPARFLRRFLRAIGATEHAGTPSLVLTPSQRGLGESAMEALATHFAQADGRTVIIFDDLHRVTDAVLVSDLWNLADLLPGNTHFVFSSRVDLRMNANRHRLHHGILEIRQGDLAFDAETTAKVLARITREAPDPAHIARIQEQTEGWAAGVQLCALALRDPASAPVDEEHLAVDYLAEEMLDGLEPRRRSVLIRLAVAEELSPGLIEDVTGIDAGDRFLSDLVRDSMFVIAVPGGLGRFRFHHLFRSVLLLRLRASHELDEGRLARAAAAWHKAHDESDAAIDCLISASQWNAAIDEILPRSRELYERGESHTVARWLSRVPAATRRARIEVDLLYAIAERMSGRAALAEDLLRSLLDSPQLPPELRAVAQVQLASCVQFLPHPEVYLAQSRLAGSLLEATAEWHAETAAHFGSRSLLILLARLAEGRAHFFAGDLTRSRSVLSAALDLDAAAYGFYRIHALGSLALTAAWAGNLTEAVEASDEALMVASDLGLLGHAAVSDAYLARAATALQRGTPDLGALALHEGHVRAQANARHQLVWVAHVLARMIEPEGMTLAARPPDGAPPPIARAGMRAIGYRRQRESGHPALISTARDAPWDALVFEEVASLLQRGETASAERRLTAVPGDADETPTAAVLRQIARAWIAHAADDRAAGAARLRSALAMAEPEGLVQPFHFAGAVVMDLVARLSGAQGEFARTVLSTSPAAGSRETAAIEVSLTRRELELLAYLPSRLSNSELAARCFVSLNTVKTHLAHVYRKLGATSRDEAIARAQELGLIDARSTYTPR